jgi:NAD(P)-dependent dehydrogenase (short-subunit alcohol dehydrogenase family)
MNKNNNMKPKNIVVTGGNSGVGYETVRGLYEEGHNVIFGSRSISKNQEAINEITKKAGGTLLSFPLDLSTRKSVEEFAKNVQSKFDHIDILVNNAGRIMTEGLQRNELGIEMTLAINHFGPFYLTYLLWNTLCKAPEARIINVSS